jgi:uncharacterized membrane protein YccC
LPYRAGRGCWWPGVIVAQIAAELLVIRNYGLAMVAVTPLALLVGELGHPGPPSGLLRDRLVQTLLGCAAGVLCAVAVRTRTAARHLTAVLDGCARETAELERRLADGGDPTATARSLAVRLTTLRDAYDVAAGEPGLPPSATEQVLGAERRARLALTAATPRLSPAGRWPGRP